MPADRAARQSTAATLYKAKTFQRSQAFSFYDWKFPLIPVLVAATPHSPADKRIRILESVRSCKQLTLKLLWYCRVKRWAEGRALLFMSGSWDRALQKLSFLLLLSRADNSYHLFLFQTFLSPYSGLHSKEDEMSYLDSVKSNLNVSLFFTLLV